MLIKTYKVLYRDLQKSSLVHEKVIEAASIEQVHAILPEPRYEIVYIRNSYRVGS
jgi:hypothetical protein